MRRSVVLALVASSCARAPEPPTREPAPPRALAASVPGSAPQPVLEAPPAHAPEVALGVADRGVYSDLDGRVQLPPPHPRARLAGLIDEERGVLVVYADDWPHKVYPLGGDAVLERGGHRLKLRPGDASELATRELPLETLAPGRSPPPGDHDADGIPDPLDVLIGAHKAALDAADYDDSYFTLKYPGGDPPRNRGACVDVVVRAVRNAGLDLQSAIIEDERSNGAAYGVTRPDPSIDHRRVRNAIVYFERHWRAHGTELADAADPLRPGDVVFLDTFASRPGPDHVGVVTQTAGASGHPLVINLWTFGYKTRPMDLLGSVPVTHRFRFPSRAESR